MSAELPEGARRLLDGANFATVATIQPDGIPQLSVVWVKRDGDDVIFSTARGRRKTRNLERDPRVTVMVFPAENPYSYAEIRGRATITDDDGPGLIDELSQKYTGGPFDDAPGTERVIVRITPDKVRFSG